MTVFRVTTLTSLATLAVLSGMPAHAQDKKASAVPEHEVQGKLAYCKTCHGIDAQGFRGSVPIPRLAGQQPAYVHNQLRAFIEHRRTNPIMGNVAFVLSPAMVDALAEKFKNLDPAPLGGAPRELATEGKKIFDEGVESADVPSCASCHGADAKGNDEIPRLAGQLNDYIIRKVTNWNKERGLDPANPDTSALMQPFVHKITKEQLAAIAAYVSNLK